MAESQAAQGASAHGKSMHGARACGFWGLHCPVWRALQRAAPQRSVETRVEAAAERNPAREGAAAPLSVIEAVQY